MVARRAYLIHRLTRRRGDLWVAIGMVWLGSSIELYLLSPVWSPWFWGAHLLEAMGVVAVAGAVAIDLARQRPSHQLFETLSGGDLLESEEELLGGYVRALTVSLDELDPSTGAHSRRVAHLAVRVGRADRARAGRGAQAGDRRPGARHRQAPDRLGHPQQARRC